MQAGSVLKVRGEAMRVLAIFSDEVTLEACRSGGLTRLALDEARACEPTRAPSGGAPRSRGRHMVYLVDMGYGHFKIGHTKNLSARLRGLRTASIVKPRLVRAWHTTRDDAIRMETEVKRVVRERRLGSRGGSEVFKATSERAAAQLVAACAAV